MQNHTRSTGNTNDDLGMSMIEETTRQGFRSDINGLRAVAVAAVVLFHFGVPGFAGGFVGVDIFFAISGFLMTKIVVCKLERGEFSILGFYLARARRIIPALAVLCATLLAAGWLLLLAPDYKLLSSHVVYSLAFLSNVEYWQEAGYFDIASHEKWLLHTWSLSVEWQFYLLLPVVAWLAWRLKPGRTTQLLLLGAATLISLALSGVLTASAPTLAFYLLPARAWEMLAGGLVFLVSTPHGLSGRARRLVSFAGLGLIVLSIAVFDKRSAWPGLGALLPVAGTAAVLLANRSVALLDNRVAQWLGDRSYSIYLWHWPIYVALVYVELNTKPLMLATGLIATLVAGHLSYTLVERWGQPRLSKLTLVPASAAILAIVMLAAGPALLVWRAGGVLGRFPAAVEAVAAAQNDFHPRRAECHVRNGLDLPRCRFGGAGPELLLLGDSHASAVVSAVQSAFPPNAVQLVQLSYSGCPFVAGLQKTPAELALQGKHYQCSGFINKINAELATQYPGVPVILTNRYAAVALGMNETGENGVAPTVFFSTPAAGPTPQFMQEFAAAITETACTLAKHRPVYLIRPFPEMGRDIPRTLSRRMSFGVVGDLSVPLTDYRQRNDWVWAAQDAARARCGIKILDPIPYLCRAGQCYGSSHGRALYFDDDHLSEYGNKLLIPMFQQAVRLSSGSPPVAASTGRAALSD